MGVCGDKTYGNACNAKCSGEDLIACDNDIPPRLFDLKEKLVESLKERDNDNVNPKIRTNGDDTETDLESACVKQCDDDRYHPVCCGGETYRNECEAKCAGQSKDTCTDNSCEAGDASANCIW